MKHTDAIYQRLGYKDAQEAAERVIRDNPLGIVPEDGGKTVSEYALETIIVAEKMDCELAYAWNSISGKITAKARKEQDRKSDTESH